MHIDWLVEKSLKCVNRHLVENGAYRRWLWQDQNQTRNLGVSEYGCADAANILYTIGHFPQGAEERSAFVRTMQSMQDKHTGMFSEPTHHRVHTTAHMTAALELFEEKPLYAMTELAPYKTKDGLYALLESIDYAKNPWDGSHIGAGVYAALVLNGEVDLSWQKAYFDWFWNEADPKSGLWRKGFVFSGDRPVFYHLAGTFHYLFNHEYAKMPLHYPEKVIDTCLWLYKERKLGGDFGNNCDFLEVDFVFTLSRACRQSPHRFAESREVLRDFAVRYYAYLEGLDFETHDGVNDLHRLFGVLCCAAELQSALPGFLISEKPLRLVLDRRPFI